MKTQIQICIFTVLGLYGIAHSQTINTGDLYVMPNTQFSTVAAFENTASGTFINDGEAFIYSHFANNGIVDFTPGNTGYTRFEGTAIQQLSGANISYFYDVRFNNPSSSTASFELSSEISIDNEADFNEGIVKNDDFGGLVIFENNASHMGAYDGSHVDGQVQKNGDTSFEYPIGDAQWFRYAAISAPDTANDVFTAKYFFEDTNTNYPVSNLGPNLVLVDTAEYWTVERSTGDSDVLVTLTWDDNTTPADILQAPLEGIHIVRWDPSLQLWIDEGGVIDEANQTVTTAVDDYGVFTLGRVKRSAILPCDLTIYNLLTPNDDGINDVFEIRQAINDTSCAQNMNVKIFNRWGVKVFEAQDYDEGNKMFNGFSEGRATVGNDHLPIGTYFYILTFDYQEGTNTQQFKKAGYLYINGN
ncbi:gliding motility-associated C-terminal domain-containing protein [Winogradskyella sp.]|uniref:gliding motility-associated C-terminal domain-containing protein n=1 Tax=Winogradskyella sp. TaxID=1883156 RepID=UPI00260B37BC|nr:gliding motility-associated C-terminal domain-containing protein [Winogradskyella sp.]